MQLLPQPGQFRNAKILPGQVQHGAEFHQEHARTHPITIRVGYDKKGLSTDRRMSRRARKPVDSARECQPGADSAAYRMRTETLVGWRVGETFSQSNAPKRRHISWPSGGDD
ncbi:hypothetical protein Aco04nite_93240 [Winogradskya consettensis]|uniref:Uncharacterized protein n=1 Tax=Winogradskya consettensis TaxID=113560 RepID=A0A919W6X1_9ACTN|nr:hypothetical protein Aco04nite_93240 [Actinoplanes consettensis]